MRKISGVIYDQPSNVKFEYLMDWIGNGVLDNSLEDESLLCEFVGAPVSEGGAESLVVGPPHVVVEAGAWLFQAGVVVPAYELLLQEPVGGFDHGVAVRVALP